MKTTKTFPLSVVICLLCSYQLFSQTRLMREGILFSDSTFQTTASQDGSVPSGQNQGDLLYWNDTTWVVVPAGEDGQTLKFCQGVPTWTSGNCPGLASMVTNDATGITINSAFSGGNITDDGGSPVTVRGICWNTAPNPSVADDTTVNGSGAGSFISQLTGLTHSTVYYVRAYAINGTGVGYGNEINFSTLSVPTLVTTAISNITFNSAQSGGNVLTDGGSSVTARGLCWSLLPGPTLADSKTVDGNGTGSFTSSLTGLLDDTTYYVRAYATNGNGTGYGNEVSFNTLPIPVCNGVTDIDGNFYNGVQIGSQCWMKENLKVTHFQNGDLMAQIDDAACGGCGIYDTFPFYYENFLDPLYGNEYYGYMFDTTFFYNDLQSTCPVDWHIPSDEEWKILEMYLGMSQADADASGLRGTDEGGKLKESGTTHWNTPNTGATNSSGFTALPTGFNINDPFNQVFEGDPTGFWTSSIIIDHINFIRAGRVRILGYDHSKVERETDDLSSSFYIRCIRDY